MIGILLKVPVTLLFGLLIGNVIGVYLISLHYFVRDWHLLNLNWTALTQLFTRGSGGFRVFIIFFATLLGAGALIGAIIALIIFIPYPLVVNLALVLLLGFSVGVILHFYQKNFWNNL